MRKAAKEQGLKLRWGGCWDVDFTNSTASPENLVSQYVASRKKIGKNAFIDAPHFEVLA